MRKFVMSATAVSVLVLAACSNGPQHLSPTGPSAAVPAAFTAGGFSVTSGNAGGLAGGGNLNRATRVAGVGTVASLKGTCPALTMVVRGVRVVTTDETTFVNGECGNLRPGTKVDVEGDLGPNGDVVAETITITDQPGGPPVEGEGIVGSRKGSCPTLTLVVHGHPVMTTSDTVFVPNCDAVVSGARIRVTGTIAANSVLATEVEVLAPPAP
ncbi:MAG: DUF5666 domain-containing protein [Acidobacteriota bacterium]